MSAYIVEILPKSGTHDPAANHVHAELVEAGESPQNATVSTSRLFRIEGPFGPTEIDNVAKTLLVDPVVEVYQIEEDGKAPAKKSGKAKTGWVLDIWLKAGVTDPAAETIEKGLRDLGFASGVHAATAQRYVFPKIAERETIEILAKRLLANELIHDIHVRKIG